jgi:hypothetical protein
MVELTKKYWKDVSCMILQDSIKDKSYEITKYKGLSEALEKAEIISSDNEIKNFIYDLISQSTEHENRLKATAKIIRCEFITKKS